MIIISQVVGTSLTDLAVDEEIFTQQTSLNFQMFEFDGSYWTDVTPGYSGIVTIADYGISFTGTPVANDTIIIAYEASNLWNFSAGKGINCIKINQNFADIQNKSNSNENQINNIEAQAILKNGTNITQDIVDDFNTVTPIVLTNQSGTISLQDNTSYYISLSGNTAISLPTITSDSISHTITAVIEPNNYSFDLSAAHGTFGSLLSVNTALPYQVMFIYNKIDEYWYYSLGQ